MSRTYTFYLAALDAAICVFFIIHAFFLGHFFVQSRTVRLDVMQGFLIGVGLAFVTAQAYAWIKAKKVNGWITMFGLGVAGNGMLLRAAHAQYFPGPVNVPEEAMYWWTNVDGAGHTLNGERDYTMHFPPGGLPPNDAFWSLTMGDAKNRFVANPINRYSVSNRYGLVPNADGSVDIYIQDTVGKRATGTDAGDFLISGPRWRGCVPPGISQIPSPNDSVLVIGRVFVESNSDLPTAHNLAKQIRLAQRN